MMILVGWIDSDNDGLRVPIIRKQGSDVGISGTVVRKNQDIRRWLAAPPFALDPAFHELRVRIIHIDNPAFLAFLS